MLDIEFRILNELASLQVSCLCEVNVVLPRKNWRRNIKDALTQRLSSTTHPSDLSMTDELDGSQQQHPLRDTGINPQAAAITASTATAEQSVSPQPFIIGAVDVLDSAAPHVTDEMRVRDNDDDTSVGADAWSEGTIVTWSLQPIASYCNWQNSEETSP